MPDKRLGSFMLLSETELLASPDCSQTVPDGMLTFLEDKVSPPTRAYLKLWEVFTRLRKTPKPGEQCIDLGSCPGGWTWVLAKLGASVISVDRSAIDPAIARMPQVTFIQGNAFTLDPSDFPLVEHPTANPLALSWIFSDVICDPHKLLELVHTWQQVHPHANYICTLKFKGETNFLVMQEFLKIKRSFIIHLTHNKHEVTWVCLN
jgi:23S rRNA (cytidine2498-2'-O)-methyltransferase